jgi:aromatic ring hydroxylase
MIGRVSQLSIALSIKTKANKYFNLCKTITNNFFTTLIIHQLERLWCLIFIQCLDYWNILLKISTNMVLFTFDAALKELYSHYMEAWKSWYSEVAGKRSTQVL